MIDDYHKDHQSTHEITWQALEWASHTTKFPQKAWRTRYFLEMEINSLITRPNVFVNIDERIDQKLNALDCYKSQLSKENGYYRRLTHSKAQLRGIQAGCAFAEAFRVKFAERVGPFYPDNPSTDLIEFKYYHHQEHIF